jgi:hypothetical protein
VVGALRVIALVAVDIGIGTGGHPAVGRIGAVQMFIVLLPVSFPVL